MHVLTSVSGDRRVDQRIDVFIPATLEDRFRVRYAAMLRNISLSGVLLSVESREVPRLLPNDPQHEPRSPRILGLEFHPPGCAHLGSVRVSCSIAHLRRISGTSSVVGLNFRHFNDGSLAILEEFWRQRLAAVALEKLDL